MPLVPSLKITIDSDVSKEQAMDDVFSTEHPICCSCQSEYCNCGSSLGVTESSARKLYTHLGFTEGRSMVRSRGYRETALHIWGTHNLSTEEVLSWLGAYDPLSIEWINDASCNVVFSDPNTVLRIIVDQAEPFDRRVALSAAAALAALLEKSDEEKSGLQSPSEPTKDKVMSEATEFESNTGKMDTDPPPLQVSLDAMNSIEEFSQYLPPSGRWFKALSVPSKAISLFLRFAHTDDVKLPGAERRSLYYRRYGNPNYDGVAGLLKRSCRRRLQGWRKNLESSTLGDGDQQSHLPQELVEGITKAYEAVDGISFASVPKMKPRPVFENPDAVGPAPDRQLIVYDNVYDADGDCKPPGSGISDRLRARIGTRREAVDFPIPGSPRQPRKWPRKNRGPPPDRWLEDDYSFSPPSLENIKVFDLREPWMREADSLSSREPFVFGGKRSDRRVRQNELNGTTTITLMPGMEPPLSPSVPDDKEDSGRTHRMLYSMRMVADLEEEATTPRSVTSRLGYRKNQPQRHRTRDVWNRLG